MDSMGDLVYFVRDDKPQLRCHICGQILYAAPGAGNFGTQTYPLCGYCSAQARVRVLQDRGFTRDEILRLCALAERLDNSRGAK